MVKICDHKGMRDIIDEMENINCMYKDYNTRTHIIIVIVYYAMFL